MPNKNQEILRELRKRTPESGKYWEQSKDLVPGGLISVARKMVPYPIYVARGKGAYIWDIDGNRYIDCTMSYGVHILGHGPQAVLDALNEQCELGMSYGTPHTREVEFTQRLIACIPCAEMVMLCNTGTESTLLAWRLMRAAAGKPKIAKFEGCYHGWHDYAQWSVGLDPKNMGPAECPNMTPDSGGIPDGIRDTMMVLPFNDNAFDLIEKHAHELAGVAIEPVVGGGMLAVDKSFLRKLREVTQRAGVLLHFDEVITGFRLALGGYQELSGVQPDVATYGKIIGGGLPIGAVACSKDMVKVAQKTDDGFSAAGTFSGNPLSLTTGAAVVKYLQENSGIYPDMMDKGEFLRNGFNAYCASNGYPFCMTGIGSMFQIHAKADLPVIPRDLLGQDEDVLGELQLHFRLNHILLPWIHLAFFSAAHDRQDLENMLKAFQMSAAGVMKDMQ